MKSARVSVLAVVVVFSVVPAARRARLAAQQPADQTGISAEGLAQIAALLADKQARTPVQQKIDSQLLYQEKMEFGAPVANGIWFVETDLPYAGDGHVVVDVRTQSGGGGARGPAAGRRG